MADEDGQAKGGQGRRGVLLGAVAGMGAALGGFAATYLGLLPPAGGGAGAPPRAELPVFLTVPTITLTMPPGARTRVLRFGAALEVDPAHAGEVERLMPRVTDILNVFLRALEPRDLERPAAIVTLRAQMLRRVRIVVGPDRVRDLLITEFVLS